MTAIFAAIKGLLGMVPGWLYAIALALLAGYSASQAWRLHSAQSALATEKLERVQETSERNRVALREAERVAGLQTIHAKNQQELTDAYSNRLAVLETARRGDAADAQRVRRQLAEFAARDREAARTDPAACERVGDRSAVLADLVAEGRELVTEGRRVIEGRDAEVTLLLGIVPNDRALLAPADYSLPTGHRLP